MISIPGRIPIHIFPFFWLLIVMIGWLNSASILGTAIWSFVILVSVLIHEFGHALTALAFGQRAEISLVGLGGITKRDGPKISRWKEFFIVLNGPVAGLLLFFLLYQLLPYMNETRNPFLTYAIEIGVEVNLVWTILNLVPVLPLDGGHLLRILLEGIFGVNGLKIALFISLLLAAGLALFFLLTQQFLIGALFLMMGFESYRSWSDIKVLSQHDDDKHLHGLLDEGIEAMRLGHQDEALTKFFRVKDEARGSAINVMATQYIAQILADQGHYAQAYEWLLPIQKKLSNTSLRLLQETSYRLQDWTQATKIGQEAYQKEPRADTALINALSYAILGDPKPAVGWLRCAIQSGLTNIPEVLRKREFDSIRDTPEFRKLAEQK